uniref:Aflatoxin B1 aldehyde reductase member 4 n=1 Tax=Hirondellea gigas TaxID=1518452 RepID=A0A6A7G8S2_9CRUS
MSIVPVSRLRSIASHLSKVRQDSFISRMMSDQKADPPLRIVLGAMDFGRYAKEPDSFSMIDMFLNDGHSEIDTALMYAGGKSEKILGRHAVCPTPKVKLATKVNPGGGKTLSYGSVMQQFATCSGSLNVDSIDILYLHLPDHDSPIEETLRAVNDLHKKGKFRRFGLSNFSSWEVTRIWYICKGNGWVMPTVYQGMYSAITRSVEAELLPALRTLGIQFYAYSPLGGGILSGKHSFELAAAPDSQAPGRFFGNNWASVYRDRYWHRDSFEAIDQIKAALKKNFGDEVTCADASLRWVLHHSALKSSCGDGLILGASKKHHLEANLKAIHGGPLPEDVVATFDNLWTVAAHHCPTYFR